MQIILQRPLKPFCFYIQIYIEVKRKENIKKRLFELLSFNDKHTDIKIHVLFERTKHEKKYRLKSFML